MSMLPRGLLSLPTDEDKRFAKAVRKARLVALRCLFAYPADGLSPPLQASLARLREVLVPGAKRHGAMLLDAVGSPDVLPVLLTLAVRLGDPEVLLPRAISSLMSGLVHYSDKELLRDNLLVELPVERILDGRGRRTLLFSPPAKALLADASGFAVQLGDSEGTRVEIPPAPRLPPAQPGLEGSGDYHRLASDLPRLHLSLVDANPLSMYEAHPDKDGNAIDLGGKTVEEWQEGLGEGLELIRSTLPGWYQELSHALERIVPVGYGAEAHLSASYREAPGTVYMTLHPNRVTLAEAIIHETQHGKANAFSWSDALLLNGMSTWTESAVRPDLRPLWGVLLAVHAFVPVSALHHGLAEQGHPITEDAWFARRRAQVIQGNSNGIKTLKELANPTPLGREMLDSLYELHAFLENAAPPPPEGIDADALPPG